MKITFVTSHMSVFTGAGKFIMDYANKLSDKGYDITVIAQIIDQTNYKFNEEVSLIEIGGPLPSNPLFWLRFKKNKKQYLKVLNKLDYDLIVSNYFPSNYICANINKKKNIKNIYYCHEPFLYFHNKNFYLNAPFFLKIFSWFLRRLFKKYDIEGVLLADDVVCNSNFTRKKVMECYGRDSYVHFTGVEIHENINELDNFNLEKKLGVKKNTPIIFTLGLTHHMKGAKELMHIFKRILNELPEIVLLIGGWIRKENKVIINNLIKKLKIPYKNIFFCGFIEKEQLNYYFANSTLTFFTAINEAFGLIPLESMQCGTPVIAFEGGPSDTIIDGQTGYLIKNYEYDTFAKKAIKLIKEKSLYEKFSYNAIEHVRRNFSIEKGVINLELIFNKIISKN